MQKGKSRNTIPDSIKEADKIRAGLGRTGQEGLSLQGTPFTDSTAGAGLGRTGRGDYSIVQLKMQRPSPHKYSQAGNKPLRGHIP